MGTDLPCKGRCFPAIALQVIACRLQKVKEELGFPVYFAQFIIQILDFQEWLHLANDAAHIFSAQDAAGVGAVLYIALVQPSCDAACIIAYMLIAYRTGVGTIVYFSLGIAGDAAGIRMGSHVFRAVEVLQILQGNIFEPVGHVGAVGIDIACIGTVVQSAFVDAADAAGVMFACYGGGGVAAAELSGGLVDTANPPCFFGSGHFAADAAVQDFTVIDSGKDSIAAAVSRGQDIAGNGEAAHSAAGLYIAEQPQGGTGGSNL